MKRIYTAYGMENGKLVGKFDVAYEARLPIGASGPVAPGGESHSELGGPFQSMPPDSASIAPESADDR